MGQIMYDSMWKVNFKGIKGDVYFDPKTGSAPGTILIQQIRGTPCNHSPIRGVKIIQNTQEQIFQDV